MDIKAEAVLRTIGLFSTVYFTLTWGQDSKPDWDAPLMIGVIILAVLTRYVR